MRVISGGQTGVDRAALGAATTCNLEVGGWCPPGREAEDGPIPAELPLRETPRERSDAAPAVPRSLRTEWNVRDADATLIVAPGARPHDPGTAWAARCAVRQGKPLLTVDPEDPRAMERILEWLRRVGPAVLNVAGPSETTVPGIERRAREVLTEVFASEPHAAR